MTYANITISDLLDIYANITIGDLLDTYMYAERPDNFEGITCDADKQAVEVIFNS